MLRKSIILAIITLIAYSCCKQPEAKLRIAISKEKSEKSTTKYADWLLYHDSTLEHFYMYPIGIDSSLKLLETCNGLLVTGGEDVYPGYYGKEYDTVRCGKFDRYRDSLEMALIDKAIELNIPIFGVCRGEQIINVNRGGTLYIDIPTDFDSTVAHRQPNWERGYHPVWLVENTKILELCGNPDNNLVVSSHHQGIEELGKGLIITSYASDSIPESIEWSSDIEHPYLIATQWHPEAMEYTHSLSAPLALSFLEAAESNRIK